jgi:hypothetical protein
MNTTRTCGSRIKALVTTFTVCIGLFLAAAPIAGAASWDSKPPKNPKGPTASWVD